MKENKNIDDKYDPLYKLTSTQRDYYIENGYLIVDDLIPTTVCDKLIDDAQIFANKNIHNYLNFHRDIPSFTKLIKTPQILDIADQLQNARMIPIGSIYFFGKPNNPLENGSLPHQDNYAAKAPEGSYFVVSVALDDCDHSNGALIVYPGSHKLGELPFIESKNFEYDDNGKMIKNYPIGNEVQIPDEFKAKTLDYKKGSVIFLHTNTIHAADKNINKNEKWRRQFYMHYIKDGDPFWPGWSAKRQIMDRGPRRI